MSGRGVGPPSGGLLDQPLKTIRGKRLYEHSDGALYRKTKTYPPKAGDPLIRSYWQCQNCKKTITTVGEIDGADFQVVRDEGEHCGASCIHSPSDLINRKAVQQIQALVASGVQKTAAYNEVAGKLLDPAFVTPEFIENQELNNFPSLSNMRGRLQVPARKRYPPIPRSLQELVIDPEYREILSYVRTRGGVRQLFLQSIFDIDVPPSRNKPGGVGKILVFATNECLVNLSLCEEIFVDGTFKIVPKMFVDFRSSSQVFTFNRMFREKLIPCIFVLLPGKTKEIYVAMLRKIQDIMNEQSLRTPIMWRIVHLDFELALRDAFRSIHPLVEQKGCYFHFCKAVFSRIQGDSILLYLYKDREHHFGFKGFARRLMALAFLPPDVVMWGFDKVLDYFTRGHPLLWERSENVRQFVDYFKGQWLSSQVQIMCWNAWKVKHRTNNALEGLHLCLSEHFGTHPGIWKFIDKLQAFHETTEVQRSNLGAGQRVNRLDKKFQERQALITTLTTNFEERLIGVVEYLNMVSRIIYDGVSTQRNTSTPSSFVPFTEEPVTEVAARQYFVTARLLELSVPIPSVHIQMTTNLDVQVGNGSMEVNEDVLDPDLAIFDFEETFYDAGSLGELEENMESNDTLEGIHTSPLPVSNYNEVGHLHSVNNRSDHVNAIEASAETILPQHAADPTIVDLTLPAEARDTSPLDHDDVEVIERGTSSTSRERENPALALTKEWKRRVRTFLRSSDIHQVSQITWTGNDIPPTASTNEKIERTIRLSNELTPTEAMLRPIYEDRTTHGQDMGGLFSQLTSIVSGNLFFFKKPFFEETMNGRQAVPVLYFSGQQDGFMPSNDPRVQADLAFFKGLGKYLCLVLMHGGQWPRLHISVLTYLLNPADTLTVDRRLIQDLGPPYTSLFQLSEMSSTPEQIDVELTSYAEMLNIDMGIMTTLQRFRRGTNYNYLDLARNMFILAVLRESILPSLNAMREGFYSIPGLVDSLTLDILKAMYYSPMQSHEEFFSLVDIEDLREQDPKLYSYFRGAIDLMECGMLLDFLGFATGVRCAPTVLKFNLMSTTPNLLPVAHTCFRKIDFWPDRYHSLGQDLTESEQLAMRTRRLYDDLMIGVREYVANQSHFGLA